jgi:large subunit ribosomal protein L14
MLQERSLVEIIDNSGAVKVMLFSVTGKNRNRYAKVGSVVRGSVRKYTVGGKVGKGDIVSVLITGTKKSLKRKDGTAIKFSKNCGVIVNKNSLEPVGTRVLGPIAREIKDLGFSKIVSLAPEVL